MIIYETVKKVLTQSEYLQSKGVSAAAIEMLANRVQTIQDGHNWGTRVPRNSLEALSHVGCEERKKDEI